MISKLKITTALAGLVLVAGVVLTPMTAFAQSSPNIGLRTNRINHLKERVEKMDKADDQLMSLSAKLQDKINTLANQGKDVTSLQNLLSDMKSKLADASTQYEKAKGLLNTIQSADSNFKDEISQIRTDVKAGAQDLKAARSDRKQIRQGLQALR